ncbi:hypothetical protein D3C73_1305900 [compost metagenome]
MGAGGDVLDGANLEASSLKRTDCGFASGSRALDEYVNLAQTVLLSALCSSFGSHLGSERGGLTGALEANLTGGSP